MLKSICGSTFTETRARARASRGAWIDEKLFASTNTLLEFLKNALDMLNVGIFFNEVYLILMHKTIDIGALFNEARAKELSFA